MQSACHLLRGAQLLVATGLLLVVGACTSMRESRPERTATEELLITTAAERAARDMAMRLPDRGVVFVNAANFEGPDGGYAVAAIRDALLERGLHVVDKREQADLVIEVRAGALSIDDSEMLVGIPSLPMPLPLTEPLKLPKLALFGRDTAQGVAQFSAAAYDLKTGALQVSSGPHFGFSQQTDWTMFVVFSWTTDDLRSAEPGSDQRPQ